MQIVTTFCARSEMAKTCGDRVDEAAPGPHDDTACVRILIERAVSFYGMVGSYILQ